MLTDLAPYLKAPPGYRPWTKEEARGKWVRRKLFAQEEMITHVTDFSCFVDNHWVDFTNLKETWEQVDGNPCGERE